MKFENKHLIATMNKEIVDLSINCNEISEDDIQKINLIDENDIFDSKNTGSVLKSKVRTMLRF